MKHIEKENGQKTGEHGSELSVLLYSSKDKYMGKMPQRRTDLIGGEWRTDL